MKTLFEPKSGLLSVPYQPDEGSKLLENPPRFTWMPGQLEDDRYMLQISTSPLYEAGVTTTISPIPITYTLRIDRWSRVLIIGAMPC